MIAVYRYFGFIINTSSLAYVLAQQNVIVCLDLGLRVCYSTSFRSTFLPLRAPIKTVSS